MSFASQHAARRTPAKEVRETARIELENRIAAGWEVLSPSSQTMGWADLILDLRSSSEVEHEEIDFSMHHLVLWEAPARGEIVARSGIYVPYLKQPGMLNALVPGALAPLRKFSLHTAVFCTLHPRFLLDVEAEMDVRPQGAMRDNHGFSDPALRDLVRLLLREVHEGGLHGRLYADSLKNAVATRLLLLDRTSPRSHFKAGSLPTHLLRRSIDFMEANLCNDVDISSLAGQTGYSRTQFLKMFTTATGIPPHRYLLNLRLEKARALLAIRALPLVEVAAVCGFSSQSHLTTAFRKRFGMAPGKFARSF